MYEIHMKLIKDTISLSELKKMSEEMFDGIVKAVVDIKKEIMMVDAPMHADQESALLTMGSEQGDLWGINLHPFEDKEHFIEFDSMINLRPSWGNKTRGVDNSTTQEQIKRIVDKLVKYEAS